jgi:hypothetical protein
MNDIAIGKQALSYFHNASLRYSAYPVKSLEGLLALYGSKADIYADGIGLAIRVNEMSDRQVSFAMENLALASQGKVPKDHQGYTNALGNVAGTISYLDLTKQVVKDVIVESAEGLANFGDGLKTIMSIGVAVMPVVAIWLAYKYLLAKGKSFK